ncbi:MAG: RDD family protein [Paraburkholderia sp.]|uniref:RDD family protein n=1 Tax=Paraburkholderia sp. TaxID=1926495 RepID=UPI00120D8C31|nr:RDD family protein [Paraburkholderia sp.]TAL99053.1 MAG: RDD family protein [Paraburkholderia sp.]
MTYTSWTVRTLAVPSAIWLAFACGLAVHTLNPLFAMLALGMCPLALLWAVAWLFASALGKERLPVTQSDLTSRAQPLASAAPAMSPAGVTPPAAASTAPSTITPAAPLVWRRYAARTLDLLLWTFLAGYAVAFINTVTGWHLLQFRSTLVVNMSFLGMVYLPLALFLDALVYAACGNSIGKALLGIRVVEPDGAAPSFDRYLARNFSVWARGLAFGLPVAQPLVMILNAVLLKRDGITAWDARLKFRVVREPCAAVHYLLAVVFAALLVSTVAYHRAMHHSAGGITPAVKMQKEATRARPATAEILETVASAKKL